LTKHTNKQQEHTKKAPWAKGNQYCAVYFFDYYCYYRYNVDFQVFEKNNKQSKQMVIK